MANSRSNIYPVQLQGAELNLNKFDAEIKQYSGFNKNNSPFVGGCLSNLFTKTEENTTGSSDSVYVDNEGNTFTVDSNGLYKNGVKVIAPEGETFETWEIEKLELPENTVFYKYYNNDLWCYITQEQQTAQYPFGYFIIHTKTEDKIITSFQRYDEYYTEFQKVYWDAKKVTLKSDITPYTLKNIIAIAAKCFTSDSIYFKIFLISEDGLVITDVLADGYYNKQINLCKIPDCDVCLFYTTGNSDYNNKMYLFGNAPECAWQITLNYDLSTASVTAITDFTSSSITNYKLLTSYIKDYFFFHKEGEWYGQLSLISNNIGFTPDAEHNLIKCRFNVNVDSEVELYSVQFDPVLLYYKFNEGTGLFLDFSIKDNRYLLKNYGVLYGLRETKYKKSLFGVCDYLTDCVTLDDNYAMFYAGGIVNGTVLVNNGLVSGIALPGGKILATDWNTVDKDFIFFQSDNSIVYKSGNTFYRLYKTSSKPKIKEVNGILVLNTNQLLNCYRLSDNKVMTFAPAWNNRTGIKKELEYFSTAITENINYFASSMNEYDLKDNASIILNPVPIVKVITPYDENENYTILYTDNLKDFYINLYQGTEAECLYAFSFNYYLYLNNIYNYAPFGQVFFREKLKDLPFPLDTNGNVQLSPSLFCEAKSFGNDVFIKEGSNAYQLIKDGAESVMSYYLGTLIENLEEIFILQGQYYAIINKQIFNVQFSNGVVQSLSFVVSVENLQFCGNSAYQAYFFSKTNRCIYVFTGANILNQLQLVDKISEIYAYKYNQSTQSIILITDLGTIISSNLGMYLLEGFTPDDVFFYDKGVVFVSDNELTYLQSFIVTVSLFIP